MVSDSADVVVVGAGVIGLSVAANLAQQGIRDIQILEKESMPGTGSTAACTGGIRLQFSSPIHVQFSLHGLDLLPKLAAETEIDIHLERTGYLFLFEPSQRDFYADSHVMQRRLGVSSRFLNLEEIGRIAPFLETAPGLLGSFCPHEAHADPHQVVSAYRRVLKGYGIGISTKSEVIDIVTDGRSVRSVQTTSGSIATGRVVNCAGPFAAQVAGFAGSSLPLTPRRRHVLTIEPAFVINKSLPLLVDADSGWYLKAEPGGVALMGGTDRDGTESLSPIQEPNIIDRIVAAGMELAPSLENAKLVNTIVGLRCMSPDDHAIVGEDPGISGLVHVAGFSGHGFMHAPAAGLAVAELIARGKCESFDLLPFSPARFDIAGKSEREEYIF